MKQYNPKEIESKWQKYWAKTKASKIDKDDKNKQKFYILDMFPYPSGSGLHMGHTESYTASDVIYRYKKLQGFNVLHPQGFDAFGLPAENYAIKTGISPIETTKENMANYIRQMQSLGFAYDFSEQAVTCDPEYYKWTQCIFGEFYKNGLVYKKTSRTNWCPSCQTVIANEQVVDGNCDRCGTEIEQREVPSWFFKITDFAEELIADLDKVDWPEYTKKNQRNWIGRSEGVTVKFQITSNLPTGQAGKSQTNSKFQNSNDKNFIKVFTTRVDTIFGCTYVVLAPENGLVAELKEQIENKDEVEKYIEQARNKTELSRMEAKEKTGVELKGIKAVNPFNSEEIPVFIADYVLANYGTGAVMAVPAHDERDFEFAKKYELPIREIIIPNDLEIIGSGALICNKEGKFIFQKRDNNTKRYPGMIAPFAGGRKEGESPAECLKREIKEEIGLDIDAKNLYSIGKFESHYEAGKYVNLYFIDGVDPGEIKVTEGDGYVELFLEDALKNEKITDYTKEVLRHFQETENFASTEDGVLVDSEKYSGLSSQEARGKMSQWLEEKKLGKKITNYRLRDWSISRQRYWGCPIPIVYSPDGEAHLVPEGHLPWKLPMDVDFVPTGTSPLAKSAELKKRTEEIFGEGWTAEYDTMDTFVDSSWYFLRYPDAHNDKEFCSKERLEKWLPVDVYIGGAEHTYMHLLFARFFVKAMQRIGLIDFDEPFLKLRHQGMVLDKEGKKMSKSKGNVINPDDMVERFGADSVRAYILFAAPLEDAIMWNEDNIIGIKRFLDKVWKIFQEKELIDCGGDCEGVPKVLPTLLHKTIKKVTNDIENFDFNTAISQMMIFVNEAMQHDKLPKAGMEKFLVLLAPFAPHITEEIWSRLGHQESIFLQSWPKFDEAMAKDEEINLVVQVNGKMRDMIKVSAEISEEEAKKIATESEKIKNHIQGKEIKKIIFIPGRLLNIVV